MTNHSAPFAPAEPGRNGAGEAGGSIIKMAEVTAVLRRWWWQCTLAGLVCAAAAGGAVWATFTPVYEALAILLIKSTPDFIAFQQQSNGNAFAWTQLETMRSPIVLSRVAANRPELVKQAEADGDVDQWLAKKLQVRFVGHSDLCQITFQSQNPEVAASVVNAVVDEFLSLHQDEQSVQTDRIIDLLITQQRERQSEVENIRKVVRGLTKKTTGHEPLTVKGNNNNSMVMAHNPLADAEQRRVTAEVEYDVLQCQLRAYQEAAAENKVEIPPEELQRALYMHPEVKHHAEQVAYLEHVMLQTRKAAAKGENDRATLSKIKELEAAKKSLDELAVRLRPVVQQEVERELLADQVDKIHELQMKVEIQKRMLAQWSERVEKERKEMERHGDARLDLQFAEDDLARSEQVHSKLADRIVALKTERLAPARAIKQHSANVPKEPVEKVPFRKLGVAGFGAFLVPFGLAFLWERIARRVSDGERLTADTNLQVLGEVATLPTSRGTGRPATNYFRERVTFEESVDSLRVTLMHLPESANLRTLLVTSAISAEGKTNLATSLAISLARATHEPLLIIDGDMRDPDVHEIFGVELRPGLANVLDDTSLLEDAIVKTEVENVDLLPAGRLKYSPHFLLRNGAFQTMLTAAKKKYRYVVIDSPPVLSASEAVVLAHACDGVLVCTRCDYSRSPQLRAANERLHNAGARVLGAVISGVPTRSWAQRYGGYGYGWERYAEAYHSFYTPRAVLTDESENLGDGGMANGNGHS